MGMIPREGSFCEQQGHLGLFVTMYTIVFFKMKNVNSDVAYDFIRKNILSGEYPPGHSLMTKQLSTDIGVSRTPVRDALRQLENDGLVSIQARLGASVKKMNLKECRDLCDLRLALESHAAGLAALNRSEVDLAEMQYALEAMRRLTTEILTEGKEDALLRELAKEDVRFHIAIMTAAKNEIIKKEILRLHLINRVVMPQPWMVGGGDGRAQRDAHRPEVIVSHDEIYSAVFNGNAQAAKLAMERHIQDIIDHRLSSMARAETGMISRELTDEELAYSH